MVNLMFSPIDGDERFTVDDKCSFRNPMRGDLKRMMAQYGIDDQMDIDVDKMFEDVEADMASNRRSKNARSSSSAVVSVFTAIVIAALIMYKTPRLNVNKSVVKLLMSAKAIDILRPCKHLFDRNIFAPAGEGETPDYLLKDGQKFMNLDQIVDALENNPANLSISAKAQYRAKL